MIADIFGGPVQVEEKVDGSQFSFCVGLDGQLHARSKGKELIIDAPEKMFEAAVTSVKELATALRPGWVYRGEYLQKPKHNTLAYARTPDKNIILFDVMTGNEEYLTYSEKLREAARIGIECVPLMYFGNVTGFEMFSEFLERESILGGCKVEGVVVKNYNLMTAEKKIAIGKYVSEVFKEVHGGEWRKSNPTSGDIISDLGRRYRTDARWTKAVQHLREAGKLEGSPRDIAGLMREVPDDILKECEDEIKAALFAHAWPHIKRAVTAGLPEWYKEQLAKSAFGE
jgi:hypothetical protein